MDRIEQLIPNSVVSRFFSSREKVSRVHPLGDGNINETFLVELDGKQPVVLQCLNGSVFPDPAGVAENVSLILDHLHGYRYESGEKDQFPRAILTTDGKSYCLDDFGRVWRALSYLQDSVDYQSVNAAKGAFEGGRMLGRFHYLLKDFDGGLLSEPLPGFHDLPGYCRSYLQVRENHRRNWTDDLRYCCRMVENRLADAALLEERKRAGRITACITHGDPKSDNMLYDRTSHRALALIDLDTVSVGLLQHDLGDCLRSFCNPAGEKPLDIGDIRFDTELCGQLLAGYRESGYHLSYEEQKLIYHGVRLLTFELGLRFLTDYLEGNRYFKVLAEHQNLRRAFVQFRYLESVELHRERIESIVAALWG